MGLCKCRNVTNLFCFEHRKNVCESCIVESHSHCIVRSYLQWLQDSDFNSVCELCHKSLDGNGNVVRLTCLDLFHIDCINDYCTKLPKNTAISGYTCPGCSSRILPPSHQAGPLAVLVRSVFQNTAWAKHLFGTNTNIPTLNIPAPKTPILNNINSIAKPIPESSSGIVPSAQFPESSNKSQTRLAIDPDDRDYKSKTPIVNRMQQQESAIFQCLESIL
ncbi:hypothetical protein BC833DRAFT_602753 [Globomyces pollinis-pini]|nr:hypothetical protein BC833DRAFT_602753 [Globomyces pollinis-pini]